jgi:hypothetical protein
MNTSIKRILLAVAMIGLCAQYSTPMLAHHNTNKKRLSTAQRLGAFAVGSTIPVAYFYAIYKNTAYINTIAKNHPFLFNVTFCSSYFAALIACSVVMLKIQDHLRDENSDLKDAKSDKNTDQPEVKPISSEHDLDVA